MKKSNSQIFWQLFGEFAIPIVFAILIIFLLTSCLGSRATQKTAPAQEEQFLTTKNLPQFGGKEFFAIIPSPVGMVLSATGVDSLIVPADTVRIVPQKNGAVAVYADPATPTSAFSYGPDTNGQYVLLGRPSAVKGGNPTLIYEGKDWTLLYGGEGIVIDPRGSTRILPGWKPDPSKKN